MSIEDLINDVMNQDFAKAGPTFNEIMQQKLTDAIDQEKIRVAGIVFNNADDVEEEDEEEFEELSDDEIGEIVDEEDDEE